MKRFIGSIVVCLLAAAAASAPVLACTNLLVTKGASADGSVMITYTCDGEFHPHLEHLPAADYPAGDSLAIRDWADSVRGYIHQVEHTYAVVSQINEHQLAISETTFGGREELRNPDGLLHYWDMMILALQRARTAREAITVMTDLVERYGYRSGGESFSIADTEEAWILEMIGPGEGGHGAAWVAVRVPDGYIAAHANKARIGRFPRNDTENCVFSTNIESLAIQKGFFDPGAKQPFSFADIYCPPTPANQRYADARVWSLFRRAAPSLNLSADYHRAIDGAEPYPLWIKPDTKISTADVFDLMRDHYEGTPYDMTVGVDAGSGLSTALPTHGNGRFPPSKPAFHSYRSHARGSPIRSAAYSGMGSTTPTPLATSRSTAASIPSLGHTRSAAFRRSRGSRPGGSLTSSPTTPV